MPAPLTESYWAADSGTPLLDTSVAQLLRDAATAVPDRLALIDAVPDPARRRTWTYAEFLAVAERVARALRSRYSRGDRVAIYAPNCAEWLIVQHGVSLAGNPGSARLAQAQALLEQGRYAEAEGAAESARQEAAEAIAEAEARVRRLRAEEQRREEEERRRRYASSSHSFTSSSSSSSSSSKKESSGASFTIAPSFFRTGRSLRNCRKGGKGSGASTLPWRAAASRATYSRTTSTRRCG